ncbi:hypothetical protein V6N13_025276 [Hibiscus sabdariffa]|uniref:Uncharacterized protein n=1 Tax=Hibiscus sabdariffa TaxID=183260 RepID=A0ABR2NHI4_9ROSI
MAAVRGVLLKHPRMNAMSLPFLCNPNPTPNDFFALTFGAVRHSFSDEVMGSFLDKSKIVEKSKESEAIWQIDALREHVKSGLPWISAVVVMLKLLYQMALSGFVLPSFAEVAT